MPFDKYERGSVVNVINYANFALGVCNSNSYGCFSICFGSTETYRIFNRVKALSPCEVGKKFKLSLISTTKEYPLKYAIIQHDYAIGWLKQEKKIYEHTKHQQQHRAEIIEVQRNTAKILQTYT